MEKINSRAPVSGPEPEHRSDIEAAALNRELRQMAELLLDIYIDKRQRKREKNRPPEDFDGATHGE